MVKLNRKYHIRRKGNGKGKVRRNPLLFPNSPGGKSREFHINLDEVPSVIYAKDYREARKKACMAIDILSSEDLQF